MRVSPTSVPEYGIFSLWPSSSLTYPSPALDLTPPCPPNPLLLARWTAEPTRFLFLPATTFIANPKGYPVLPKSTQRFIREIITVMPDDTIRSGNLSLNVFLHSNGRL